MTLQDIRDFRDRFKDFPMVVVADNQHIFYDNIKDTCPLIWDDTTETLMIIDSNQDQYNQQTLPITIEKTEYEHIQFMKALVNTKDALAFAEEIKGKLGDDADKKLKYIQDYISKRSSSRMCIPSNVPREKPEQNTP